MFPDTISVLTELKKKYRLIVVTSSERKFLNLKLKVDNLNKFFSDVFSMPNDFKRLRKEEQIYREIIDRLHIKPEEMVHIGDNYEFDYGVPKKIGIKAFFLDRKCEKKGKDIVHSLKEFEERINV